MNTICLDITKAAQFLADGAVNAYEAKVNDARKALEEGTCRATTSSVGFTFRRLSLPHSYRKYRIVPTFCVTIARPSLSQASAEATSGRVP